MDAHAIPTPTMVHCQSARSWMKPVASRHTPPHTSASECTIFRLVFAASGGRAKATRKQTIEYHAKVCQPNLVPSSQSFDFASVVWKICWAVARLKNIHMQNRPSHVKNCTTAS